MTAAIAPRPGRVLRFRPRVDSTPARLRLALVLIVVAATLFGVSVATAAHSRFVAARSAGERTEPLVVQAVDLHSALSDADATVSSTFVTGGEEPRVRRARYLADLRRASGALTVLGREADASARARDAIAVIARDLPRYAGLIETARANNRQGFPVGAAYLRSASDVMRERLLPAATTLYAVEARALNDALRASSSRRELAVLAVCAVILLVMLVAAQAHVARATRRVFNVPLVAATVVVLAASVWTAVAFVRQADAAARAQHEGSDPVEVLSATRVLALRAQADEGLALASRGSGDDDLADFDAALRQLGVTQPESGLIAEARSLARTTGSEEGVDDLAGRLATLRTVHTRVLDLERSGRYRAAARLAVGADGDELRAADGISRALDRLVPKSQRRFDDAAADASGAVRGLWLVVLIAAAACALLAFLGIRARLEEYR